MKDMKSITEVHKIHRNYLVLVYRVNPNLLNIL